MVVVRSGEMKIHDDSERSLASLASAYYKLSESFWKDCAYNWDFLLFGIYNSSGLKSSYKHNYHNNY